MVVNCVFNYICFRQQRTLLSEKNNSNSLLIIVLFMFRLHEADNGFVLIVDRRNDKWSSVKHILFKFTVIILLGENNF